MSLFRRPLPLWVWAMASTFASAVLVLGAVAGGLSVAGRLDRTAVVAGLGFGLFVATVVSVLAGAAADRAADVVRRLRHDAVRRLSQPAGASAGPSPSALAGAVASVEVRELARTLDALHLRVRVADEVAERHRRTARTSSAGMFELLSDLVAAEEGARGQLAAELHDTVAQSLGIARRLLYEDRTSEAADYVIDAEEQVRAVMARTRPPALRDGDLASAMVALRDDLEFRYALSVDLQWPAEPQPLPLVTALTLYRFFQEGLLNVIKHADCDDAVASLEFTPTGLVARVRDAGEGFVPSEVKSEKGRHVGLGLLRERVRLAGGSLDVESVPGEGTTLTLSLPTPKPPAGTSVAPAPRGERHDVGVARG